MSTQEFADEFYENSGMGIGENRTGVLFCLDMYNRETYLTTTGDMIDIIDDQRREEIFDAQMEYLSGGDYLGAFSEALDYTDKFIEMGVADDHTGINAATGRGDGSLGIRQHLRPRQGGDPRGACGKRGNAGRNRRPYRPSCGADSQELHTEGLCQKVRAFGI